MNRLLLFILLALPVVLILSADSSRAASPAQIRNNLYYDRQGVRLMTQTGDDVVLEIPQTRLFLSLAEAEALVRLTEWYTQQGLSEQEATRQAQSLLGDGGLRIYTSLDMEFQTVAYEAAESHVATLQGRGVNTAGVVALHPPSGEVLAVVSGSGEEHSVLTPHNPGSLVKPFIYALAMEQAGYVPASPVWDTALTLAEGFEPRNPDGREHGPLTVRSALANSYNLAAIHMLDVVGVPAFVDFLGRFNLTVSDAPGAEALAAAYGDGLPLNLYNLTQAYATLANQGRGVAPATVICIVGDGNRIIYEYEDGRCITGQPDDNTLYNQAEPRPVIDPRLAFFLSDILADNTARSPVMGANSPLLTREPSGVLLPSAAKTGSGHEGRAGWTIGYTPDLVVGVYVGHTENRTLDGIGGLNGAAPIWKATMEGIYFETGYELPPAIFNQPAGIRFAIQCDVESLLESEDDCASLLDWTLASPVRIPDESGEWREIESPASPSSTLPYRVINVGLVEAEVVSLSPEMTDYLRPASFVAPLYCVLPDDLERPDNTLERYYLLPPDRGTEEAYEYARDNDIAILPQYVCTAEMLEEPRNAEVLFEVNHQPWRTAAIYCMSDGSIEVFTIQNSKGVFAFRVTPEAIAALGIPDTNTLLREYEGTRLYRLSSGDFQLNAPLGGDPNGYVVSWEGCPLP